MLKRLATNAAALALGGVIAQLAFISIEIAIARTLGREDYGIFSTVQAIALTNLIILDLGMAWWLIESGSRKPQSIAEVLGTTVVLKLIGFVMLYPLAAWGLSALGYDGRTVGFFLIFFLYSLTMTVQDSLRAVKSRAYGGSVLLLRATSVTLQIYYATIITDHESDRTRTSSQARSTSSSMAFLAGRKWVARFIKSHERVTHRTRSLMSSNNFV